MVGYKPFRRAVPVLLSVCAVVFLLAPATFGEDTRPLIAIVVDDLGYSSEMAEDLSGMAVPHTWAIIPYKKNSLRTANMARANGIPFILHLPMEALSDENHRQSLVWGGMPEETIRLVVRNALWSLPGVAGLNNHRGSRATEDRSVMEPILKELSAEGLFFLDSRTSGRSVAYSVAVEMGVPATLNKSFIDHENRQEFMWNQFQKAVAIGREKGGAVAICHARPETIRFLEGLYDKASADVQFVTVPEYLEQKSIGGWEE